jgi:opacity protein-like surface antigen
MRMKLTTATIAVLTLIAASLVFASPAFSEEEESEYARSGGYLGLNVIGGSYTRIGSAPTSPEADATAGVKVYGGYRINPAFALEIDVEWLAKSDIDTNGINGAAEIESWVATANAKIFWMHDRIQPYTLMGMGMMGATVDDSAAFSVNDPDNGFAFRFGAGLDYYITRSIVANAGVNYILPASQELEDLDLVTYGAGVQYRF